MSVYICHICFWTLLHRPEAFNKIYEADSEFYLKNQIQRVDQSLNWFLSSAEPPGPDAAKH